MWNEPPVSIGKQENERASDPIRKSAILDGTPAQNNIGESAKELHLVRVSNDHCQVVVPSPHEGELCPPHAGSESCTRKWTREVLYC